VKYYIIIKHPAATSDFLAFETSSFHSQISQDGFLAPGLCLFGDNAYVNDFYMATPFPAVKVDSYHDNYNYFHSQLRICIECAFGMLVNRWGILRRAIPSQYTIHKVVALVTCLCRLHNFLVEMGIDEEDIPEPSATDKLFMQLQNSIKLKAHKESPKSVLIPSELLNGGKHCRDYPRSDTVKQKIRELKAKKINNLPRTVISDMIRSLDLRRPPKVVMKTTT